jgi:hypothetical protein
MGMHMATVETFEEMNCIINTYFKSIYLIVISHINLYNFEYFPTDLTYAAGRNERATLISTIYLENNIYYWCSTEQPLSRSLQTLPWTPNEPDNGFPPESVLYFNYLNGLSGLGDGNGYAPWNHMCQWP